MSRAPLDEHGWHSVSEAEWQSVLEYRAARDPLDVERLAHKAAEIGFTYGALGRDYEYVLKNVDDMLRAALEEPTPGPQYTEDDPDWSAMVSPNSDTP